MALLVDTLTVPPADRFDLWSEAASKIFFPLEIKRVQSAPFFGQVEGYVLGPIEVFRIAGDPNICDRTAKTIGRSDPEQLQLHVQRHGRCKVSQQDRRSITVPGDIVSQYSSRPYTIRADEPFELRVFSFPRMFLGPHLDKLSERTALSVSGSTGLGRRLAPFLAGLVDGLADGGVRDSDLALADSLFGLLRAIYSDNPDPVVHPENQLSAGLLSRIKAFIETHLHEHDLGPARIAAAHFISTRYLHKLFEAQQVSVSRWVQQRRLERCRQDLGDPTLTERTIESISNRWGFTNPDHFSRLFRSAYGCSPRQFRELAVRAGARHSDELLDRVVLLERNDD